MIDEIALLRLKRAALAVLIGSVLTVGAALVLEHVYGYSPCKLCLTERLPTTRRSRWRWPACSCPSGSRA